MVYQPRAIPRVPAIGQRTDTSYVEHLLPKKVLKFGGSSMQDGLHHVVEITSQNLEHRPIVVVSAMWGITDKLISLSDDCFYQIMPVLEERLRQSNSIRRPDRSERLKIEFRKETFLKGLEIRIKYCAAAEGLGFSSSLIDKVMWGNRGGPSVGLQKQILEYLEDFDKYVSLFWNNARDRAATELEIDRNRIYDRDNRESLNKKTSEIIMQEAKLYMRDKLAIWGEFPSQLLLLHKFRKEGKKVFSREPSDLGILTEMRVGGAVLAPNVNVEIMRKMREAAQRQYDLYVISGYLSKGVEKRKSIDEAILMLRTTLGGRGGSDLTAVAFGAALGIPVFLYKDTNGLHACNPNIFPNEKTISVASTAESIEFGNFGSKVLYAQAMQYALVYGVEVFSLNTFNPSHPGTYIVRNPDNKDWQRRTVRGISFLDQGEKYTLAVIGHDIGEDYKAVEEIKGKLKVITYPSALDGFHINKHSVTIELPKPLVKEKAQQFYQAFCE